MAGITFYNRGGVPTAYCEDGIHIYLFNGKPVAYIHKDSVYNYSGAYLGQYKNGWILDTKSCHVFFTEEATGGPMKPLKKLRPLKSLKQLKPTKGLKQSKPLSPSRSLSWSSNSSASFFN